VNVRLATLLLTLSLGLSTAAQEPPPQPDPDAAESEEPPPGTLAVYLDVEGAVDPLVRFKTRTGHLVLRVDGETVLDRSDRKMPADEPILEVSLAPGEHVVELRWEVAFRSATDRHHPMGTEPEELGFSVPESGFASHVVVLQSGRRLDLWARLFRKATIGVQGRSWVEWQE